MRYALILQI